LEYWNKCILYYLNSDDSIECMLEKNLTKHNKVGLSQLNWYHFRNLLDIGGKFPGAWS
jgi:hypothetical protein